MAAYWAERTQGRELTSFITHGGARGPGPGGSGRSVGAVWGAGADFCNVQCAVVVVTGRRMSGGGGGGDAGVEVEVGKGGGMKRSRCR